MTITGPDRGHRPAGPETIERVPGPATPAGWPVSVVVSDDVVVRRDALASLLRSCGFDVVGQVSDGAALVDLVDDRAPSVAVIAMRGPSSVRHDGLAVAAALRDLSPGIGILVLASQLDVECAVALLSGGPATGYLLESRMTETQDVVDAIQRIARGGSVVAPEVVREMADAPRSQPVGRLSPRELEVLEHMAAGLSNLGISHRLYVAEGTVEKHVKSIFSKLDLHESPVDHRRVQAVLTFLGRR